MSKKNSPRVCIENVTIVDIADDGKAVGKSGDMVVFVPHAVPGDIVDVCVTKKRKKYVEAIPVKYHHYSQWRINPVCSHFGVCGGCKWQDFSYEQQLLHKQKNVSDCMVRIGRLNIPEISPILAADALYFYRNKLEFTFSSNRWLTDEEIQSGGEVENRNALGFHIPGFFDKVLDIDKCFLQPDPSNAIRIAIRDFAQQENIPFFNLRTHEGLLRTLVIRISSNGEIMVILSFYEDHTEYREKILDFVWEKFPEITSLMYVINPKPNDSFADLDVLLHRGTPYIMEAMENLRFKVGPKSFYQTNSAQALKLYKVVRDFSGLTGKEVVYDLFTGTGTIANFIAANAAKVIGIEYVKEAIEDAKENSEINSITNTCFYAGDMKDVFTAEFMNRNGLPDVVILDPPRAGVHPKVIDALLYAKPKRMVYVSCNPSSQARDLSLLQEHYVIKAVQPVDMFPQTHHVENVVLLDLQN